MEARVLLLCLASRNTSSAREYMCSRTLNAVYIGRIRASGCAGSYSKDRRCCGDSGLWDFQLRGRERRWKCDETELKHDAEQLIKDKAFPFTATRVCIEISTFFSF